MFTAAHGDRENVDNVVWIITNGDSFDKKATLFEAREIKKDGVQVFVTIMKNWYTKQEINAIASHPYEKSVFNLPQWNNLDSTFRNKIRTLICNSKFISK